MIKKIIYLLFILSPMILAGQEYLGGLNSNPVIKSFLIENPESANSKNDTLKYQPLELPFFDDFSKMIVYPDTSLWLNNEAYINANFPVYPPDFGVATLDAIDANGNVYEEANSVSFLADRLISKPIKMDSAYFEDEDVYRKINPNDSVYFSFYYQPQGHGDVPLSHDSLVLQFGSYNQQLVFSHYDYIEVFGFDYPGIVAQGYAPPGAVIYPPFDCDTTLGYILADTFFLEESMYIPCDSVFVFDTEWTTVWSAEGDTLDEFVNENNVFFKYEAISITDTNWLRGDFQFRFINYASVSTTPEWQSNTDHWHIDRVRLDKKRTIKDQYNRDVRFVQEAKTFLRGYSSMPYSQYSPSPTSLTRDTIAAYVHNLDSVVHDVRFNYYVQNDNGDTLQGFSINDFSQSAIPYKDININAYQPFVKRPVKYFFVNTGANSNTNFRISHVARDNDSLENGDTIVFNQIFGNYMSYDDGSVERGYGIYPSGAKCAIKYQTTAVDTIWGIQMFVNKTVNDVNNKFFDIAVWQDNNGEPGNIIYQEENVKPIFTNGLNKFGTYWFEEPQKINVGTIYVGWINPSNFYLNVGFDENNNSRTKNFFNTGASWVNSNFNGSIMIRPIFGKIPYVGTDEYKPENIQIKVYPNPVKMGGEVFIETGNLYQDPGKQRNFLLEIYDVFGKQVFAGNYSKSFSTVDFTNGFYLIRLTDRSNGNQFTTKLIISR